VLWVKRMLRGDLVYASAHPDGSLVSAGGRVEVKYKLGAGQKVYRASERNLAPHADGGDVIEEADGEAGAGAGAGSGSKKRKQDVSAETSGVTEITAGAVIIYTDGACVPNPGPMGIGVVITDGKRRIELSEFHGHGTNQVAELTAILRALQEVPAADRRRPVFVHSDSAYSIGLLTKPWKPKANQELVGELRALAASYPALSFVKVAGHAGVPENERCDVLAGMAVETRTSSRSESVLPEPA